MIIQMDTREKRGKKEHILSYFEQINAKVVRSKLLVGDYTLLHDQTTCVDVKQNVLELFSNLSFDHVRFRNECLLAQENGIQLIILTEEVLPRGGLANWESPTWKSTTDKHKKGELVTKENPEAKRKAMITMQDKYGVKFLFCNPSKTGSKIVELLLGGNN